MLRMFVSYLMITKYIQTNMVMAMAMAITMLKKDYLEEKLKDADISKIFI